MAIIKKDYVNGRSQRTPEDGTRRVRSGDKNDLHLLITGKDSHQEFDFKVQRNCVEVVCTNPKKTKEGEPNLNDWQVALSEQEKLRVFALILDEYRKHSIGDEHGYRGAVLGVSTKGKIFLGANTATQQIASSYFKECAEQNMVSQASDLVAYEHVKKMGWDSYKPPRAPEFNAIYMMGGVDEGQVSVSCPCGKCTDMLAKNMAEGGKVYALPILSRQTFDFLNSTGKATTGVVIEVNQSATLAEVRSKTLDADGMAGRHILDPYPVWQTTIRHLNASKEITLTDEVADIQRSGFVSICDRAFGKNGLLEERAANKHDKVLKAPCDKGQASGIDNVAILFHSLLALPAKTFRQLQDGLLKRFLRNKAAPVRIAAENEFMVRNSIAQLDCATTQGEVDLAAINQYMIDQITHALADRVRGRKKSGDGRSNTEWVSKHIESIRCVVVQLNDGTFHSAIQASGDYDPSMANAEAALIDQMGGSLGRYAVRNMWAMEMNPADVAAGKMQTSPKEGLERLIKRASSEGIDFTYIPLNSKNPGFTTKQLAAMIKKYDDAVIFPALFKGSRPVDPVAVRPPAAWAALELARSQAANDPEQGRMRA